jgi:hypothetical protein
LAQDVGDGCIDFPISNETESNLRELLGGRTSLVTGADGLVGLHLTNTLLECGVDVHFLLRPCGNAHEEGD